MSGTQRQNRRAIRLTTRYTVRRQEARAGAIEVTRLRPKFLAVLLHSALFSSFCAGAVALPQPALAQVSGDSPAAASALPQGDELRSFSIPAGPLEVALDQFGRTAGVNLLYDASLLAGARTQGLTGSFSIAAGLLRLLEGSGLDAQAQPGGGYLLRKSAGPLPTRAPGADAMQATILPAMTVKAQALRDGVTEGTGSYTVPSSSTATGLNLPLRRTPQSVSVVTRQQMDDQGLTSLTDVAAQAPGVWAAAQGSPQGGYTQLYSRGFILQAFQVDGVTTPSNAFSDNSRAGGAIDTVIYDSVSVVRGATGLLSGAGEPAGIVNMVRKRPTDAFQGSIAQSFGRWSQRRSVGDVSGPLNAAGTLRGRLVGAYDQGDSWAPGNHQKKGVLYGALEADLGENTLLNLSLERHDQDGRGANDAISGFNVAYTDGTPTPFGRHDSAVARWSRSRTQRTALAVGLEHRFNVDWRVKLNYSQSRFDWKLRSGAFIGRIDPDGVGGMTLRSRHQKHRVNVVQLRLDGQYALWDRQHEVVAGIHADSTKEFYPRYLYAGNFDRSQTRGWQGDFPEPSNWAALETAPDTLYKNRESGFWLATRLRPTNSLSVIAGSRWSNWKNHVTDLQTLEVTDDRQERGVFIPYTGVVYDVTSKLSAYASYTGVFDPQDARDINGRILDPVTGKNYELGLKGEWFAGRLNSNLAVFEVRKDNMAERDGEQLTPDGDFAYLARDNTRGRGWEAEVSGELAPGWHLQGGYTRMVTRASDGAVLNGGQPKHMFRLFSTWTPASLRRLTVGGGLRWQSEIYSSFAPASMRRLYTQGGYSVVDLMARYVLTEQLQLSVRLGNVFDRAYRTSTERHEYGAERNLYATLTYRF